MKNTRTNALLQRGLIDQSAITKESELIPKWTPGCLDRPTLADLGALASVKDKLKRKEDEAEYGKRKW